MSLVTAVASNNGFVAITGDRRAVINDEEGVIVESFNDHIKAKKLTNCVLVGYCGISFLCDIVEIQLHRLINLDSDLTECAEALQDRINFLSRSDKLKSLLLLPDSLSVTLVGFNKDGTTGYAQLNGLEVLQDNCNKTDSLFLSGMSSARVRNSHGDLLGVFLTLDEEGEKKVIPQDVESRMMKLNMHASYLSDGHISPDYDYLCLYYNDGEVKYERKYFSTETLQEGLPSKERTAEILSRDWSAMREEYFALGSFWSDRLIDQGEETFRVRDIR